MRCRVLALGTREDVLLEKCPELRPLLQHVMGTAAEPELGLKGERCRGVPGDAAGLVIASTKKVDPAAPPCSVLCSRRTGLEGQRCSR